MGNMATHQPTDSETIPHIKLTKAATFNGREFGDTQPMESQVYRELTESIAKAASSEPPVNTNATDTPMFNHTEDSLLTERTPHTLRQGDTGFIDLGAAFPPASQGRSSNADFDDLLEDTSPQTQFQIPGRPTLPVTPTVAGHKHGRDGELLPSTASRTPAYSQLFAGQLGAPLLSATQLFNQTQAPSSPLADGLRSDPVVSRPSPNLHNVEVTSPPTVAFSSPVATMNVRPNTSSGEPRETYTSMRESQERRAARLREELGLPGVAEEEDEEEDLFELGQPLGAGRGLRRALSAQPMQDTLMRRASSKLETPHHLRRKSGSMVDLVTPGTTRRGEKIDFEEDDEILSAEDDAGVEGPDTAMADPEQEGGEEGGEGDNAGDEVYESDANDEYDELGQTVLRSQSNMPDEDDPVSDDGDDRPSDDEAEAEEADEEAHEESAEGETKDDEALQAQIQSEHVQSQGAAGNDLSDGPLPAGTQRSAIADSQPKSSRKQRRQALPPSGPNSSITSFIPGSQYAGRTSQELAFIRRVHSDSQAVSSADRVPSSPPPMPSLSGAGIGHGSVANQDKLPTSKTSQQLGAGTVGQDSRNDRNEIPESEYTDHENTDKRHQAIANDNLYSMQEGSHSNNNILFSTARTHVTSPSPSPTKLAGRTMPTIFSASQISRPSQFSPRKAAGVRRFGDTMTEDLMPMNNSGETYDAMTSIMNGVLGEDHDMFAAIADSPVKKKPVRRPFSKMSQGISSSVSEVVGVPQERVAEVPAASASQSRVEQPASTAEEASSPVRPTSKRRKPVPRVPSSSLSSAPMEIDETVIEDVAPTDHVETTTPKASTSAQRSGKQGVFSPPSPEMAAVEEHQPGTTPNSVKKREDAGARAVSQLLSSRNRKLPPATKKLKAMKYGHAATEKAKGKASATKQTKAARIQTLRPTVEHWGDEAEAMELDVPLPAVADEEHIPADTSKITGVVDEPGEHSDEDATNAVLAPRRMFALFMGSLNNYYPATWIATSIDGFNHQVKFDDLTVTTVSAKQSCRLDLRVGDAVKVDLPNMRKQSWTVVELVKPSASAQTDGFTTDIFGHTHVKVQARAPRNSLSNTHEALQDQGVIEEVPITFIYLTLTMWTPFQDRPFQIPQMDKPTSRMETPSATSINTPSARNTPSASRLARTRVPTIKAKDKLAYLPRDEPIGFPVQSGGTSVFSGMAFAISYIASDASTEKAEVIRLIESGGGKVLEDGFEELFLLPSDGMDMTKAHQKRASISATNKHELEASAADLQAEDGLCLRPEFQGLGFVALIADQHSRRAKYMQALALNLPTLAGRWILDSCNSTLNTTLDSTTSSPIPLPWSRYLLASGESNFLSGAVRSRTLTPYLPSDIPKANLASAIARRNRLLKNEGLLMVAPKKGTANWEKRKTFVFLTLALGAGRVKRVADVKEAKALLDEDDDDAEWKWVYVDSAMGEASRVLFGKDFAGAAGGAGQGKKRKRAGNDGAAGVGKEGNLMSCSDGRVKLVNDEFVVQSLILGDLVE
jgi:hypothetical protein